MFTTAWVEIDDVRSSDRRTFRNTVSNDMDTVKYLLTSGIERDSFKEELKDNDLPYTKSRIKNRINEVEDLFKDAIDTELSIREVTEITFALPQIITDTQNFMNTRQIPELVFAQTEQYSMEHVEEIITSIEDYVDFIPLIGWFFVIIMIIGVLGAVTHCLNKGRFVKYIYTALITLVVICLLTALPMLSEATQFEIALTPGAEDITYVATAMPFVSLLLAFAPIILDIIFERKKPTV